MKMTLRTLAAAAVLAIAGQSQATVVDATTNNPLAFSWSFVSAAGTLSGTGSMTLSGFNSTTLTFNITLNNTSGLSSNRLTSFGFGITPNATGVSFGDAADGGMINASLDSIPSIATIEVCAFGGPNCSGGGSGGINGGASDSFTIGLTGNWGTSVDINPIGFKYQTGLGSFEFTTSTSTTTTTSGPSSSGVPEPGTGSLALLGLAALGAGFALRRKQAAPQA